MLIGSFNVNSINARLKNIVDYIEEYKLDIILLQELKTINENFPYEPFKKLGYNIVTNCQKSYNGVAILSKFKIESPNFNFYEDVQARFLEARILDYKVICIYVPNGNPLNTDKYYYKIHWLNEFYKYCEKLKKTNEKIIIGGDFNVIQSKNDCYDIENWLEDALYKIEVRKILRKILNLGFFDSFRLIHKNQKYYSYWDYQAGAWQKDNGIRIDLILLSSETADLLKNAGIHKDIRGKERPSDHAPVWIEISQ